jgi:transglutaminase-like putative cysteine protease
MKTQHSIILRISIFLSAALAGSVAVPLCAAAADAYAGSDWALLDSNKALAAAAEVTLGKYPDCDEATVEEKNVDTYKPDGTAQNQDEAFVKVLTEKGKRDRRTLAMGFQLPYCTVDVVKLEVIRPSGEVVPVDVAANSTETIDDSQMSENIYDPNNKVLLVNIPDLEVGDVVHWITHTTTMRSIIPGEFSDENLFESTGYIRHLVYECHAPLAKPLKKIVLKDRVPGTVKYTTQPGEDQTIVHRWEVSNVPRMFEEPSMPPYENALQRVLVSTTPDWHDVSKWYWVLSKPHLDATSAELTKTVATLTAGAKTDMEKMKALFYFVSEKIRYMGLTPEKDRPGFEPHDVCLTLSKQYGVCRDKAALLVAMLRAAGLNAYPVLVNVGSRKDEEVPDANFNHAIAGVETSPGHYVLLDPTDQHARELQPWYDGDQSYLVARPEGDTIRVSSFKPPEENLMRIKTTGILNASGRLEAKSELFFDGANDDVYRNEFSAIKPDDLRRFFDERLKKAIPGAQLKSLTVTPENMLDVAQPIKAVMEFTVDDMIASGHGKSVMSVPWIGKHFGLVNHIVEETGLQKRKYAIRTRVASGLDEQISLELSGDFATLESIPVCPAVEDDTVSYRQTFEQKDGVLNCSRELKLKGVEIEPGQYAELKHALKELGYDARKSPVLALAKTAATAPALAEAPSSSPPVGSNAVILDSQKEMDVTDAHSAVYHVKFSKRILTYAGKIKEAEIKLPFNPACEEAKFISGVVISKSGQRQEISKAEMNVMDAQESASAKRYTGGKILVANLPGVDIGSTIEVEFEIRMKDMPFIGGFEPFQLPDDLQKKSFKLVAPANLKVEKMVTGTAALTAGSPATSDGAQTFEWSAQEISALPAEAEVPPDWVYKPGVNYFVGDFKAYLKELNDTLQDRSRAGEKAGEMARQLAAHSKGKLDTVKAIRDFVSRSIRLAGPPFAELPLRELSKADTTLVDGYGHAADRAILLHSMLTAAGFEPSFVLASELPATDGIRAIAASFPLPESFGTPLVRIVVAGQTIYLNDTDQYSRLGSTSHDDKLGIDLSTASGGVIAAARDCQDRVETNYTLSFGVDGKLHMGVLRHYFGNEYNEKSRFFAELRPEEMKRYYQEEVSKFDQGARPDGELTEQFGSYPGTEKFAVELDNYAVADGKYLYFDLPFTPSLVQLPGGEHRTLPLMLSHEGTTRIRAEIELPSGFHDILIAPGTENLDAPGGGGKVRMTSSETGGKYVLTDDSETSPAVIKPEDYPAMLKVESTLEKKSGQVFLLQKD